jgi:hypothetical protein
LLVRPKLQGQCPRRGEPVPADERYLAHVGGDQAHGRADAFYLAAPVAETPIGCARRNSRAPGGERKPTAAVGRHYRRSRHARRRSNDRRSAPVSVSVYSLSRPAVRITRRRATSYRKWVFRSTCKGGLWLASIRPVAPNGGSSRPQFVPRRSNARLAQHAVEEAAQVTGGREEPSPVGQVAVGRS